MRIIGLFLVVSHLAGSKLADNDDDETGTDSNRVNPQDDLIEDDETNVGTHSHHHATVSNHKLVENVGQVGTNPNGANSGLYGDDEESSEESGDSGNENSGDTNEQRLDSSGAQGQVNRVDPVTLAGNSAPESSQPVLDPLHLVASTFKMINPISAELAQLLSQLYGKAVTDFAKDPETYEENVLQIDCREKEQDLDWQVNIVTTLCPFLRDDDDSCGLYRHSSFAAVNPTKLCSKECAKNIDAIMSALPMRKFLALHPTQKYEASIFSAIVNSILLQYAGQCRVGTWFMPN
jgi:hypothetical protein